MRTKQRAIVCYEFVRDNFTELYKDMAVITLYYLQCSEDEAATI